MPNSPFRAFVNHLQQITSLVVVKRSSAHGGKTLPAFLHMQRGEHRESQPVGLPGDAEGRALLVRTAVVPLVEVIGPELVGWTFESEMDDTPIAVVVVIDRERTEASYAPLARVLGQTLIGDWQDWSPNTQAGVLVNPIQEALR